METFSLFCCICQSYSLLHHPLNSHWFLFNSHYVSIILVPLSSFQSSALLRPALGSLSQSSQMKPLEYLRAPPESQKKKKRELGSQDPTVSNSAEGILCVAVTERKEASKQILSIAQHTLEG